MARIDYYERLRVHPEAPLEVIRASYRALMKTLGAHPDLGGDASVAQALNEAWAILSDPSQRSRYDAERALDAARAQGFEKGPDDTPSANPASPPKSDAAAAPEHVDAAAAPPPREPAAADTADDRTHTHLGATSWTSAAHSPSAAPYATTPSGPTPPAPLQDERRRVHRLERGGPLSWTPRGGTAQSATLRDVSPHGLSFVAEACPEVGATLWIETPSLTAEAVVRNTREIDRRTHLVGVSFENVTFREDRGTFLSRSA